MSRVSQAGPGSVYGTGQWCRGVPGVVPAGWVPGWVYRVGYYPAPRLVLPGPNQCQNQLYRSTSCSQGCSLPPQPASRPGAGWARVVPPGTNRARFHQIYTKVSQESGVSAKKLDEACHTPYLKKPLQMHDLEFPDFSITLAFSP